MVGAPSSLLPHASVLVETVLPPVLDLLTRAAPSGAQSELSLRFSAARVLTEALVLLLNEPDLGGESAALEALLARFVALVPQLLQDPEPLPAFVLKLLVAALQAAPAARVELLQKPKQREALLQALGSQALTTHALQLFERLLKHQLISVRDLARGHLATLVKELSELSIGSSTEQLDSLLLVVKEAALQLRAQCAGLHDERAEADLLRSTAPLVHAVGPLVALLSTCPTVVALDAIVTTFGTPVGARGGAASQLRLGRDDITQVARLVQRRPDEQTREAARSLLEWAASDPASLLANDVRTAAAAALDRM